MVESAQYGKNMILRQQGIAVWLYGLSGAGKSTIASHLKQLLDFRGIPSVLLDGDEVRQGINNDLGFSEADRFENIRRVAEIAALLVKQQQVVICSLITPLRAHRLLAQGILGENYLGVFIDCPLSVCESRDVKGLYEKARRKQIRSFTGISAPFERDAGDDLVIPTGEKTIEESVSAIWKQLHLFLYPTPVASSEAIEPYNMRD